MTAVNRDRQSRSGPGRPGHCHRTLPAVPACAGADLAPVYQLYGIGFDDDAAGIAAVGRVRVGQDAGCEICRAADCAVRVDAPREDGNATCVTFAVGAAADL